MEDPPHESFVVVISSYKAKEDSDKQELTFKKGEYVTLLKADEENGWWKGRVVGTQREGWFPKKCIKECLYNENLRNEDGTDATDRFIPKSTHEEPVKKLMSGTLRAIFGLRKKDDKARSAPTLKVPEKPSKKEKEDEKTPAHNVHKKEKKKGSSSVNDELDIELKEVVVAETVQDLPHDLRDKVKKSEIDEEDANKNFAILCHILRFTQKITIETKVPLLDQRIKETQKEKKKRNSSHFSDSMLKAAASTISEVNPKKLVKKGDFAGKGGFGRVYYAKNKEKQDVAMKRMPHHSSKEIRMNLDEIAVLNFCNHPNIVKYFNSYIWENEISVIMEYMEGGTISDAVKNFFFNEEHIAYVAREVLKGIQYLHENNIVHRDLKSANLMLSTKADVKLIDFGLACDVSKCAIHMCGSPFWISPEMIRSQPHGFPTDIWSFAISIIEMADGDPPHRKFRMKALFVAATEGLGKFVHDHINYSEQFKAFLMRCLILEPDKRVTAAELLKDPFLNKAASLQVMEGVLKHIFFSNAIGNSGFL